MLCSIYIPSRKRIERLKRTLQSIWDTAKPENFEIWLKFDDDDDESIAAIPELENRWRVKFLVAPRLEGWASIEHYMNVLMPNFEGTWIWQLNDDSTIEGAGWDEQLKAIPTTGFIVHPGIHQLGFSKYTNDYGGAFPMVVKRFWEQFGETEVQRPYDTFCNELARKNGWKTAFLSGIAINHQRDTDEQLMAYRKT